jgi:hypothetical protein
MKHFDPQISQITMNVQYLNLPIEKSGENLKCSDNYTGNSCYDS